MAGYPQQRTAHVNGIDLCFFEWRAAEAPAGTTLLVHATGFHARCWDRTVQHLQGHVIAVDMRGHGRSSKVAPYSWDAFGQDVTALLEHLDLRQVVAVGHSMGGHSVTQAAARAPERIVRLVLVDPVIMAPERYADAGQWGGLRQAADHPTSKRRDHWASADEMYQRFHDRRPFSTWQPDVLRDYCEWGLLPDPAGTGFVLACPPLVEATIYMGSSSLDIYSQIDSVACPVTVLRAPGREEGDGVMDFSKSPTWSGLAGRFRNGRDVFLAEHTHFIPMEDPLLTANYIANHVIIPNNTPNNGTH